MDPLLSTNLAWTVATLAHVAVCVLAVIVIPRRRKPTAAMAWLLMIAFLPLIGIVLYLVIGSARLPARRRAEQARITELIAASAATLHDLAPNRGAWPAWFAGVTEQNARLGGLPVLGGNTAELIGDYNGTIDAIARGIDSAQRFVHVEYFIVSLDDSTRGLFASLEAAVRRGVRVRLLADHVSSAKAVGHQETFAELDRIGVDWRYLLPVMPLHGKYQRPDLRNHRKLVVVDGRVGYIGSQNLIDRSYNTAKNLRRGLQWQEEVLPQLRRPSAFLRGSRRSRSCRETPAADGIHL